ncbi:MAG: hypothetical protein D6797_01610 [Bdellovibrio sp.]|nr:MAG: hypothetical protein D6797_01610 [Bdellovibrio sp.]
MSLLQKYAEVSWLDGQNIRPYLFVRKDNRTQNPGSVHALDWFPFKPVYMDPLKMSHVGFANQILKMEHKAFGSTGMAMPRWVFYDCAIMPGFVAGFAHRTQTLPEAFRKVIEVDEQLEWTPISLFIIIPARREGEWVAHNLSSINALIERQDRLYGLGFLTKAFGLWFANIETLCGMTQWNSPALRLHTYYGPFEILTAYTPVHSYPQTLTYRSQVTPSHWHLFFKHTEPADFSVHFEETGFILDPQKESSLKQLQLKIENQEGPFYLNPKEVKSRPLDAPLKIYRKKA